MATDYQDTLFFAQQIMVSNACATQACHGRASMVRLYILLMVNVPVAVL